MLKRDDYLQIIEEVRNIEKVSLDEYINKVLMPLKNENEFFIEILYKDINYILADLGKEGDNDLMIENGDFVIEDDDLKLTGYQTRLHDISIWLHMEIVEKATKDLEYPNQFIERMEEFEEKYFKRKTYTPEYKFKLEKIRHSLKKERRQNTNEKTSWFKKIIDTDNLELKPNIAGVGLNINEIINKFKK